MCIRDRFEAGEISAEELTKVEDAEITGLVKKEENVGLHAVTDGEYRRSFWHMDFLWGLTGTQKVKSCLLYTSGTDIAVYLAYQRVNDALLFTLIAFLQTVLNRSLLARCV